VQKEIGCSLIIFFELNVGSPKNFAGDLVTVRTGVPGTTAVIPEELDHSQCFTMLITTLRKGHVSAFLSYFLNSTAARVYFDLEGWGSAQMNISVPILQGTPIPVPPQDEQKSIVAHIESHVARIDDLMAEVRAAIDRLKELRTALISSAVTGKIDVREEAA
jgi:type I restriction enzyme S subunit